MSALGHKPPVATLPPERPVVGQAGVVTRDENQELANAPILRFLPAVDLVIVDH